jgi:glycosyltransferase involved in cell wall biosynthesis
MFSDTSPIFHLIRGLHNQYGVQTSLICFSSGKTDKKTFEELGSYCTIEDVIPFTNPHQNRKIDRSVIPKIIRLFIGTIRNIRKNFKLGIYFNLLDLSYSRKMENIIHDFVDKEQIDLLFVTRPMSIYVLQLKTKKIIQPYDAVSEWHTQVFLMTKGPEKILRYFLVILTKLYESKIYPLFDVCMLVTRDDELLINKINPEIKTAVIPNGVDNHFFTPVSTKPEGNSLIFVSNMEGNPTVESILWFYHSVFPLIKNQISTVKLYLVGRNPAEEIRQLGAIDSSVIVTGFVEDVREYLGTSTIFIAPMIKGTGIKNKVLEAMAMSKPIVSTKYGVMGIMGQDGIHYFVADNPNDFSDRVVRLLHDEKLCDTIGRNARNLIDTSYSWETITQQYYLLMNEIMAKNQEGKTKKI